MKLPAKLIAGLVAIYLGLLPLLAFTVVDRADHDIERIVQIAALGLIAFISTLTVLHRVVVGTSSASRIALTALCFLLTCSAAAHMGEMASREFALALLLAATTIAVAAVVAEVGEKNALQGVLFVVAPYVWSVGLLYVLVVISGDSIVATELFPGYSNFRFFNHAQTIQIPLLALLASHPSVYRSYKFVARTTLNLSIALLLFCSARATMLALLCSVAVAFLLIKDEALPWVVALMRGALWGGVLYLLMFVAVPIIFHINTASSADLNISRGTSVAARLYLWRLAFQDILEAPVFGLGPMRFATRINYEAAHPHNAFLQIAAEWGLPVLAAVVIMITLAIHRMRKAVKNATDSDRRHVGTVLLAIIAAVFVDGSLSGNFVMPISQVWIAVLFGWALAWLRNYRIAPLGRRPSVCSWAFGASSILATGFLLFVALPEYRNLDTLLAQAKAKEPTPTDNPRFWSYGWFDDGLSPRPHERRDIPPYLH